MGALKKLQRAGILKRLRNNRKFPVLVLYAGTHTTEEYAQELASVLQEAGWKVSGPERSERICVESVQIGVRDLGTPCPSARLLLDTLIAAGISTRLAPAADLFPNAFPTGCCLLIGIEEV